MISGEALLIAAQAIALGSTLVTANEREFSKLHNLRCEDWMDQVPVYSAGAQPDPERTAAAAWNSNAIPPLCSHTGASHARS
ncbi:MAG: hypothetical protein IPJ98_09245 [Bryobacterales bacterium]|nr:hypothetical protein [Bryobacterales bacterium]